MICFVKPGPEPSVQRTFSGRSLATGGGAAASSSTGGGGIARQNFMDSLPDYRHEPPKTPPHILLHYSTFKVVWDWVILGLTFYSVIMVPFNLAVNRTFSNEDITLVVVDSIVDIGIHR